LAADAFAGVVALGGNPLAPEIEDAVLRVTAGSRRERYLVRRARQALFVQRVSSASAPRDTPQTASTDGRAVLFAALARLDNRDELGAALGLMPAEIGAAPDPVLLRAAVERWGDAGVARCLGAFAFAMWEGEAGRLTLGRDCLGRAPLFFYRAHEWVGFATGIGMLLALPGVPRQVDELALANFLAVNLGHEPRHTFYRGIERVPSRSLVTIDRDAVRERKYWAPDLEAPPPYAREEDYVARARELFDQAVAATLRDTPDVAIAASGGLDSSAIAATAARLRGGASLTCLTLVPPDDMPRFDVGPYKYWDERDKMAALARLHPGLEVRFIAPASAHPLEDDDTRFFARAETPLLGPASQGGWAHLCDAAAEAGHRRLLIGASGNFGLSWAGRFALPTLLRGGQWATFAREWRANARESGRSLARTLAGDVVVPTAPGWLRRLAHRLRGHDPDSVAHYSALNPALIVELDLPRQWREKGFDPWFGPRDANGARHRAYRLFDHNQPGRDALARSAEIDGVELRDPHADRRLLEFLLAVPEPMFGRDGIPRWFARQVLADRLPREILDERRYGVQAVTWFRSLDRRRERIAADVERLEASPLASRLIDLPRLKRLLAEWPKDAQAAERRAPEYRLALARGVHVGRFVRWVEGANL
jgi:asparagine synthase (glutamine-hydrolysing)